MPQSWARPRSLLGRITRRVVNALHNDPNWRFTLDILRLIWEYRWFGLAILAVTVLQELAALWPVNLLGQFVDRLSTGDLGNVVWLFMAASLFFPLVSRANVILRHKMFYETDFQKRVELTLHASSCHKGEDIESAGAANSRVANAVSGITNAAYHVLGSFTPVIIKITVVTASLIAYNRDLGLAYLACLIVPALMTIYFNNWLRVLRDAQYSMVSQAEGLGTMTISARDKGAAQARFKELMRARTNVLITLVSKHQISLFVRHAVLISGQFLIVFLALAWRERIGLTPGDFTKIIGYTTQVAASFLEAAACLDAIVSYSRAYHVYVQGQQNN